MRYYFFIVIFFLSSNPVFSNYDMNSNMKLAYSKILNLNFTDASKIISIEKNRNPNNGLITLNENYIDFLKIIIEEDKEYYEKNRFNKNIRLNHLKKNDDKSPYHLLIQSEIYLQWAFTRIKFNQYFLAAYELQKAYSLLKKNEQLFPEFILNKKNLGILKILIGSIPEDYSWILNIVGIQASISDGFDDLYSLLEICETNKEVSIYTNEILFYLSFLEMNMRNNEFAQKKLLEKIENCCQKNDLMIFCSARLSLRLGQNDRAIQILENRNNNNFYFHYLDYLYAMSVMYKQDYIKAEKYFLQFTDNFRGSNYIKSAYHKLYHISVLTNSIEKQEKYKYLVLNKGNSLIDEDRRAEDEIKNNNPINIDLLTATLLYDGGYYKKALEKLISIDSLSIDNYNHKIEFAYRNARVYQKLEDKKTISYFKKLIGMNNSSNLYYFPMSNLQIGLEYEKQGNIKQALYYFNQVFDYKDYDYENGIKKSAQAAINRLSN